MNFAWAHKWIKTFSDSADKVVDLYADVFLFEDRLLGQCISDKEELRRAFKVFENTTPLGQQALMSSRPFPILGVRITV